MQYVSPIYAKHRLLWTKTLIQLKGFIYYRKKIVRLMLFQSRDSHTGPLFKDSEILKSFDKTAFENCIFISKSLKGLLPPDVISWFRFSFVWHSHDTRWSNPGSLKIPSYHIKTYGRYSMLNTIYVWNHLQKCHQNVFFLIGIHSIQSWTATTRHGVTRKRNTKRLRHTGNLFRKNLQLKDVC